MTFIIFNYVGLSCDDILYALYQSVKLLSEVSVKSAECLEVFMYLCECLIFFY